MLGETLDHLLLRSLAHRRAIATEDELNRRADSLSAESLEAGVAKFTKVITRFEGAVPVDPELRYLDMGCGTGELTIAFAKLGVKRITGVDFLPRSIEKARVNAKVLGVDKDVQFVCQDLHNWVPTEKFDVLLSFDAFEHIEDPKAMLARMRDFATPNGIAVLAFGPLFHSPFGDHMGPFFKLQVPWRGVLFSEKAILRVREECYRPTDRVNRLQEIAGGLNLMRYSEFLRYVEETGWKFRFLSVNTFLKKLPALHAACQALMRVPGVRDYFVHNVYAVLERR